MDDKTYLVRFKEADLAPVLVEAERVEIHGEHLVFLRATGELSAMFLFEILKDWSEIGPQASTDGLGRTTFRSF
jgi:hypothetical protein